MNHRIETESDLMLGLPFSLACEACDRDSPESWCEAVVKGWTEICADSDGLSWNYIGLCPDHPQGRFS
jgi:hypothetical protein